MHRKENTRTCTVHPLRDRADIEIRWWPPAPDLDAGRDVRLGLGGPVLGPADAGRRLVLLDATWRHVGKMEADCAELPVRSLPAGLVTAYPRVSRLFQDPDGGLATVEALYVAVRLLQRDSRDLLSRYRWRDAFLAANATVLSEIS
ncbi:MAG: hypothetical protein ACOCXJ_03400 [Planctomycetota bacterium]